MRELAEAGEVRIEDHGRGARYVYLDHATPSDWEMYDRYIS